MEPTEEAAAATQPGVWYRVARLLPAAVALLSALALPTALGTLNYVELAVTVLGLGGAALYYFRKHRGETVEAAFTLFWLWALLQLPNVLLATPQGRQPLWDTSDIFGLRLDMGFKTSAGNLLQMGLNLLPIAYFAWLRRLRIAEDFGE